MTSTLKWSHEDYSLRDFEDEYKYHLPCMVEVTQGYCGYGEEVFTFSTNEVYRIDRMGSQSRVVARADTGVLYSIPVAYPLKFRIQTHATAANQAMYLEEILSMREIDEDNPLTIVPEHGDKMQFWQGADRRSTIEFGQLKVISTYEDKYFIANSFLEGQLWDGLIVPLFLGQELRVRVADGLIQGGKRGLDQTMKYLKEGLGNRNDNIAGNKDIMVFNSSDVTEEGIYEYVEPSTYVSCSEASRLRKDVVYETPKQRKDSDARYQYTTLHNTENQYSKDQDAEDVYSVVDNPPRNQANPQTHAVHSRPTSSGVKHLAKKLNIHLPHLTTGHGSSQKPVTLKKPVVTAKPKRDLPPPPPRERAGHSGAYPTHSNFDSVVQSVPQTKSTRDGLGVSNRQPISPQIGHEEDVDVPDSNDGGYVSYKDVQKSVKHMSIAEVGDCLRLLGLATSIETFKSNDVDGSLLMELDVDVLTSEFGLTKFQAIKVTKFAKSGWRPT